MTQIHHASQIIQACSEAEIQLALTTAKSQNKSLYVTSGGWNWGYGETSSIDPKAIHLDLSKMNRIIHFDARTGIIRIEPGVTQEDLLKFLIANKYEYCVPNTGAGARGSILGNALERGFGIAPVQDHAGSILSVRGLLADGKVYESALNEIDPRLAESFSWGVGPQLDKLVSQSSWLIVTQVSVQLEKKALCTDVFMLPLKLEELAPMFNQLHLLLQDNHVRVGSIKVFNQKQVENVGGKDEWILTMVIYSHPLVRKQFHKIVKNYFSQIKNSRKMILSEKQTRLLRKMAGFFPSGFTKRFIKQLSDFLEMFHLANGLTSEVGYKALDVNYNYVDGPKYDMVKFTSRLSWFSPLCIMDGHEADKLLNLIKSLNTHQHFRFNTYTWTVLNRQTLALVIPILYDEAHEAEFWPWYQSIHCELKKAGFIPYRFHIKMMDFMKKELLPNYFSHIDKFEKAFDPDNIIQRGKYS